MTKQYRELAAEIEARILNREESLTAGHLVLKVPEPAEPAEMPAVAANG